MLSVPCPSWRSPTEGRFLMTRRFGIGIFGVVIGLAGAALSAEPDRLSQEPNTWSKRSPLKDTPPSPGLSYETSLGYDPVARRVIRWGGHAQGGVKGSGEQIAETWTLDP